MAIYNIRLKNYDKTNMIAFALSLWDNFNWGLTYFNQFIKSTLNACINIFIVVAVIYLTIGR